MADAVSTADHCQIGAVIRFVPPRRWTRSLSAPGSGDQRVRAPIALATGHDPASRRTPKIVSSAALNTSTAGVSRAMQRR